MGRACEVAPSAVWLDSPCPALAFLGCLTLGTFFPSLLYCFICKTRMGLGALEPHRGCFLSVEHR